MTSPVAGSRRTNTSEPSKRKFTGRRTAWLRPLRKSLAVGMLLPPIYTMIHLTMESIKVYISADARGLNHARHPAENKFDLNHIHRAPLTSIDGPARISLFS